MMTKTRREKLIDFVDKLYCPVSLKGNYATLMRIISENDYRGMEKQDEGKMLRDCLIIETKGRGQRETFAGFFITRVDVGAVSSKMMDIAIHYPGCNMAMPKRVAVDNIKINIPEE